MTGARIWGSSSRKSPWHSETWRVLGFQAVACFVHPRLCHYPGRGIWRQLMAKALMWIVIVIFLIGLLVVLGVFDLIF
jgi:hypothetical protein